jgi:hypothetical protein
MDAGTVAIGGIVLIPLIVSLIQLFKRFAPNAPSNLWLALSFVFAFIGMFVTFVIADGGTFASALTWELATWAAVIVQGLAFGLAASKAYDESAEARGVVGNAVRGLAGNGK